MKKNNPFCKLIGNRDRRLKDDERIVDLHKDYNSLSQISLSELKKSPKYTICVNGRTSPDKIKPVRSRSLIYINKITQCGSTLN